MAPARESARPITRITITRELQPQHMLRCIGVARKHGNVKRKAGVMVARPRTCFLYASYLLRRRGRRASAVSSPLAEPATLKTLRSRRT
jgi:hypothetical protein